MATRRTATKDSETAACSDSARCYFSGYATHFATFGEQANDENERYYTLYYLAGVAVLLGVYLLIVLIFSALNCGKYKQPTFMATDKFDAPRLPYIDGLQDPYRLNPLRKKKVGGQRAAYSSKQSRLLPPISNL